MRKLFLLGSLAVVLLGACVQYDPVYTDDLDLVVTNYDNTFSFSTKTTFAMPDSVVLIDGSEFSGTPEFAKPAYADTILGRLRKNMTDRGWVEVAESNTPDVIILPSAFTTTFVDIYYSYGYWNWYYPGYGGGWYYPYWGFPIATTYKTGTVLVQMVDPSQVNSSDNIPVVWVSIINGLLEGKSSSYNRRITTTVDQAFTQSPYFKKD